jgi:hypothetical protein
MDSKGQKKDYQGHFAAVEPLSEIPLLCLNAFYFQAIFVGLPFEDGFALHILLLLGKLGITPSPLHPKQLLHL